MKWFKRISIVSLVVLVGIQWIPTRTNINSVVSLMDFAVLNSTPENVKDILSISCYNCHSNNTNYPWYSRIQPIGLFLENHIYKARAELNFNEFGTYSVRKQKSKLKSMVSQIEENEMPLASYTFIHRDARLSKENKTLLIEYFKKIRKGLE